MKYLKLIERLKRVDNSISYIHGNIYSRWVQRSKNRVAHLLVRQSIHHDKFKIWIDIPDCVLDYYLFLD